MCRLSRPFHYCVDVAKQSLREWREARRLQRVAKQEGPSGRLDTFLAENRLGIGLVTTWKRVRTTEVLLIRLAR